MRKWSKEWAGAGWRPALLFCLWLSGLPVALGQEGEPLAHFPVEATGEIHFMADGAVFLDAADAEIIRFYLAVPEEDVLCVPVAGRDGDWMQFGAKMRLLDAASQELYALSTEVDVPCGGGEKHAAFARRVVRLVPDDMNAWQIIGGSSCYLKLRTKERLAIHRVNPTRRSLIRSICSCNGIQLPD